MTHAPARGFAVHGMVLAALVLSVEAQDRGPTEVDLRPAGLPVAPAIVAAPIPAGFDEVVVFATNSMHVKNDSVVVWGDLVVNAASPGPVLASDAELTIGPRAATPAGRALKGDSVRIKAHTKIGGDVHYNDLVNQGTIGGSTVTPLALPVFPFLPSFHTGTPGTTDVVIPADQTQVVAPGAYRLLSLGTRAKAILAGGVYDFSQVSTGTASSLWFDAASEVRIAGRLATGTDGVIGPAPGASIDATNIVFYVAGINGTTGTLNDSPKAAELGVRSQVTANLYVPNGTLVAKQGTTATGAFLARDVEAGPRATFTLESAFFNRPPVAGDDSATVDQGASVSLLDSGETSLLANDSDPDGGTLTVSPAPLSGPSFGVVVLNPDGTFTYSHDGSDTTADSFVYEICDEGFPVLCASATVTITIVPATYTVTVSLAGAGSGQVTSTPAGIDCGATCSATFADSQPVVLTATADLGSTFAGWSGDPGCATGTVVGPADVSCVATFDLVGMATLTVVKAGTGDGVVVSDPAGIFCGGTCSATFGQFARIDLVAEAAAGSVFVGFSGDPDCEDGFLALGTGKTCVATFDLLPPPPTSWRLRVVLIGGGAGTVSSFPPGILCTADCSAVFADGTTVTLGVRPDPDATFVAWGGDCSGTDFSTTVVLDADKTCTAELVVP
ncbi:MAG TPA: Ig-like domain-containing protein [Thermoanaerobaculia bacterium]|nr:Ig-like domain-containing protein [Thermoanaerobaculia bacterium]